MAGVDIVVPSSNLILHQPKIREIAMMDEIHFFQAVQCLTVSKNMLAQDETLLTDINNFQIFMMIMTEKEAADKKAAVFELFNFIFPEYKYTLLPRSLIFNFEGGQILIDESNFEDLQEVIRQVFCVNTGPMDQMSFNPADAQAKAIADKLMRGRQRVAAEKGESQSSIFSQYLSTLTVGLGIPLSECLNLTMFQLFDLIERYSLYIDWDIDIRARLAGAQPDGKPENWMKNIH